MTNKKITSITTLEYLEKFPSMSSLGLARMMYDDNPLIFNSIEHARVIIRTYRGSNGKYCRDTVKNNKFYGTGILIPDGEEREYQPYELPSVNNSILYVSDIHFPFQDKASVLIALEDAKDKRVNTVILGGDILDFYSLSRFDKEPNKENFIQSREMFWQFIDTINTMLPNAKVFWIEGNHENRFSKYMLLKAPEIFKVTEFSMRFLFDLRTLGVEYIDRKQFIKAGSLNIMHGHEYKTVSQGVNPARGMFLRARNSVVFGHYHKTSEHTSADIRDNITSVYSVGCLCYLHPEYMPLNDWNSGFALIEIHKDGTYMVKNKKIVGGKIQ